MPQNNSKIGNWFHKTRQKYRNDLLNQEKIDYLTNNGIILDYGWDYLWKKQADKLIAYYREHNESPKYKFFVGYMAEKTRNVISTE